MSIRIGKINTTNLPRRAWACQEHPEKSSQDSFGQICREFVRGICPSDQTCHAGDENSETDIDTGFVRCFIGMAF